jgi:hypothetical protein
MRIIAFINDPAVPGIWCGNPVCPMLVRPLGEGMERKTFKDKNWENVASTVILVVVRLIGVVRPQWLFLSIFVFYFAMVFIRDLAMIDPPGPYAPAFGLCV